MEIFWCSLLLIFSIFFIFKSLISNNYSRNLPPTPPALPVLGHLHHLKTLPHRALQALSKNYGLIIYLHFGFRGILLISTHSVVEQCFTKNDIIFPNRPESLASKILGYNRTTLGFSPYGDHWRNLRRLSTQHIFSSASLLRFASIRVDETHFLVEKLLQDPVNATWRKVNLKILFSELVYNVIMMMVTGKRGSMEDYETFEPGNIMDICDYSPLLKWVGFKGMEKKLINLQRKRDDFLQGLIDENRSMIARSKRKTLVQELFSFKQTEPKYYTDEIIKAVILPMFTAGTHTTSLTMEWAVSLLLNHPEELKKARFEIDNTVTPGKLLEDSDLPKLSYLHCIINETLRLYNVLGIYLIMRSEK